MGRVTIFSLEECPHCKRAKAALKERGIPYTEISLSTHPQRRSDVLVLSDRLSVPQVFFNEKHIGGADETIALLKQWDEEGSAQKKFQEEVESKPDPVLQVDRPTTACA